MHALLLGMLAISLGVALVGGWLWLGILRDRQRRAQWQRIPPRWRPDAALRRAPDRE